MAGNLIYKGKVFRNRDKVTCTIRGKQIKNARISVSSWGYFICQNILNGDDAPNRFGYKYSWKFRRMIGTLTQGVKDLKHIREHIKKEEPKDELACVVEELFS